MGIKGLYSYLRSKPELLHVIVFDEPNVKQERDLILFDALGFMQILLNSRHRCTKLLFDFSEWDKRIKWMVQSFKRYGFKLMAFIDGRYIKSKNPTMNDRAKEKFEGLKEIIGYMKQLNSINQLSVCVSFYNLLDNQRISD